MQIDLSLENAGADTLVGGVTTFGQVFARGELSASGGLVATVNGVDIPVQMDVKTTYDDGSVKMAVLSLVRPELQAGSSVDVSLSATASATAGTPIDLASALSGHSFSVDLSGSGQDVHVDVLAALKQALADGTASFWQSGPLATQARVEIPLDGSQRLVFDVTAFEGGGMSVEASFNNDVAMGSTGGAVSYDLTVNMDGHVVSQESVTQDQYQNWHQSFSSNEADGGQGLGDPAEGWLNIRHDVAYLESTGAIAHYDLSVGISDSLIAEYTAAMQADGWGDPLATNGVMQYMPNTGGRADIGFTTAANTAWLMSQDPYAAAYALGQAETASAVTWHLYDEANGTWLSVEDYPDLWTDGRGGTGVAGDSTSGGLTQQISESSGWVLDTAHQPDLSYVPYLLTGERWMLDNLNAQASWSIASQWPDVRGTDSDIVVDGAQVRASAWALRQIDEAAWAAPDGSAEKAYFTAVSEDNWAWLVSKIPEWTAQQGEAYGYLPGDYGTAGALPPWQQDYFASTAIAAASKGNADALTFLEWQSNFLIGRFTHQGEGFDSHDGAAYLIAISDPTTGQAYQTWAEIGAQTDARGWSNNDGWDQSQGDYAQLALATLAGIAHLTGSAEAAAAYDALLADNPPFTTSSDFSKDPTFAIAAPGADSATVVPDTGVTTPTDSSTEIPVVDDSSTVAGTDVAAGSDTASSDTGSASSSSGTDVTVVSDAASSDTGSHSSSSGTDVAAGSDAASSDTGSASSSSGTDVVVVSDTASSDTGSHSSSSGTDVVVGSDTASSDTGSASSSSGTDVTVVSDTSTGDTTTAESSSTSSTGSENVASGSDTASSDVTSGNGTSGSGSSSAGQTGSGELAASSSGSSSSSSDVSGSDHTVSQSGGAQGDHAVAELPDAAGTVGLSVWLGSAAWQGNAEAIVRVDGVVAFSGEVKASYTDGGMQVDLGRVLADTSHTVEVQFTNDAWGGGDISEDRNLHVLDLQIAGVSTGDSAPLFSDGSVFFSVQAPESTTEAVVASTDDHLTGQHVFADHVFFG